MKKYFNTIFIYNISKYIGFSPVDVTIVKTNCKVQMITYVRTGPTR